MKAAFFSVRTSWFDAIMALNSSFHVTNLQEAGRKREHVWLHWVDSYSEDLNALACMGYHLRADDCSVLYLGLLWGAGVCRKHWISPRDPFVEEVFAQHNISLASLNIST